MALTAHADNAPTPALMGELGLNTVPSARMDPVGTMRVQASRLDPYLHASFGVQVAAPLYVNIRQTVQTPGLFGRADALFPGIDAKLRLVQETAVRPAVAVGWLGAAGEKRLAGEYLALSKRWNSLDFTSGLDWGRLGSSGTLPNPLRFIGHFGKRRDIDSDAANEPADWFTGDRVGLFGGVGWDTPIRGLTLKADWSADRYSAETGDIPGFHAPKPWSFGFSYSPRDWVTFGAALIGTDKIYGSVSFQAPMQSFPGLPFREPDNVPPFPAVRFGQNEPAATDVAGAGHGLYLSSFANGLQTLITRLQVQPGTFLPDQLNEVLRLMAPHAGADNANLVVQPEVLGLSGPSISFDRRDLEQALAHNDGSPQEIWRHVVFGPAIADKHFPEDQAFLDKPMFFNLVLDNKLSLSEDDHGLLYRTSLLVEYKKMLTRHWVSGQSLRLNLADNLQNLNALRPINFLPVRSDEDIFAERRVAIDRSYLSYMRSLNRDWHYAVTAGYLEEMYGGAGGEILYRPFGRTYAFGAEMWEALKRDPYQPFNLGFTGDHLLTGHLKAWYEIPGTDLTLEAKVGRYLAEDVGGTLSIVNRFRNGASVEAFMTATNLHDDSLYGGTTNLYSGLRLTLPLGNLPLVPSGSEARALVAPIGRDTGQSIDNPLPLYDLTEQFSYRGITDHWTDIQK